MANTKEERSDVIQQLIILDEHIYTVANLLVRQGRMEEAEKLNQLETLVSRRIDKLLGDAMLDWADGVSEVIDGLEEATQRIENCIEEIKREMEVAENVVKALGVIDEVLQLAAKLGLAII